MALTRLLITLLSTEAFLVVGSLPPLEEQTIKREFFELNTAKLREFWHKVLVRSIIKAHARNLLRQLPYVERVVFQLCANDASTAVELAKCAVRVFDTRDFYRGHYGNNDLATGTRQPPKLSSRAPVYSTGSFVIENPVKPKKTSHNKEQIRKKKKPKGAFEGNASDVPQNHRSFTKSAVKNVVNRTSSTMDHIAPSHYGNNDLTTGTTHLPKLSSTVPVHGTSSFIIEKTAGRKKTFHNTSKMHKKKKSKGAVDYELPGAKQKHRSFTKITVKAVLNGTRSTIDHIAPSHYGNNDLTTGTTHPSKLSSTVPVHGTSSFISEKTAGREKTFHNKSQVHKKKKPKGAVDYELPGAKQKHRSFTKITVKAVLNGTRSTIDHIAPSHYGNNDLTTGTTHPPKLSSTVPVHGTSSFISEKTAGRKKTFHNKSQVHKKKKAKGAVDYELSGAKQKHRSFTKITVKTVVNGTRSTIDHEATSHNSNNDLMEETMHFRKLSITVPFHGTSPFVIEKSARRRKRSHHDEQLRKKMPEGAIDAELDELATKYRNITKRAIKDVMNEAKSAIDHTATLNYGDNGLTTEATHSPKLSSAVPGTSSFIMTSRQEKTSHYKEQQHKKKKPEGPVEIELSDVAQKHRNFTENTDNSVTNETSSSIGTKPQSQSAPDMKRIVSKFLEGLLSDIKVPSHIKNLRVIRDHFRRVEKCNEFFAKMNEDNRKLLNELALGIDSRTPVLKNDAVSAMEDVLSSVNSFVTQVSSDKMSFMSPRFFSLFPETRSNSTRHRLLSPTMFSFQKDGYFSLPELFRIVTSDASYQQLLLNVILHVSGAGKVLQELVDRMKPEIEETRDIKLPLVEELSRKNSQWKRAHATFDDEQRLDYKRNGYAFMNEKQLALIYDRKEQDLYALNITELGALSKEEKISRLEQDIRALAALDQDPSWLANKDTRRRRRRQAEEGITFITLSPFVFTNLIGTGAALEVATLSPQVFLTEILYPRFLLAETLSPRAFIAIVLSPNALLARTLSPTVFRVEVLAPRAIHAWVVSPEAFDFKLRQLEIDDVEKLEVVEEEDHEFRPEEDCAGVTTPLASEGTITFSGGQIVSEEKLAEILTPRFLDPRVVSPIAMLLQVLSPGHQIGTSEGEVLFLPTAPALWLEFFGALSPSVYSPETASVIILSPEILSPRICSKERMVIEVLSPHILGGSHSQEEVYHIGPEGVHRHSGESEEHEHHGSLAPGIHIINP